MESVDQVSAAADTFVSVTVWGRGAGGDVLERCEALVCGQGLAKCLCSVILDLVVRQTVSG